MPVNIALELLVYVKPGAVRELIPILGIIGERGPVHKPMWLIGGIVAHVDTDVLRDLSRNCCILFGGDRARERHNQAKARSVWPVTMGAIKNGSAAEDQNDRVPGVSIGRYFIKV